MLPDAPFNVKLLDVASYIDHYQIDPVRSLSIYEPSSRLYDTEGLFSEKTFGSIGSSERLVNFGYIDLHCQVLQPLIYKNVIKLGGFYDDVMAGHTYAIFDEGLKNFVRCDKPAQTPGANTGYSFFMSRFRDIDFQRNDSRIRDDRIDIIAKYDAILFCDRFLVMPAGLRDLEENQGRVSSDDINKLYQTLLSYSFAIPVNSKSTIYDSVRYNIQKKVTEIYDYVENIIVGKNGFIQGKWGHRRIALGTRNVITAANYATMTPDDIQALQPDETKVGLFQTMKALQPIVVHYVSRVFMDQVFSQSTELIALINPKTYELEYCEVSSEEMAKYNNTDAIENWISKFQNVSIRNQAMTIYDKKHKPYYFMMVYDEGDTISLFRNYADFKASRGGRINRDLVRPLTWVEMFYMSTYNASQGKHVMITRYPVIQDESCYPSRIHLCTTTPSRVVGLSNTVLGETMITYPQYPILGKPYLDSLQIATARLKGLDGDYDGDTVSCNAIMSDEANAEIDKFLNSIPSIFNSQKELLIGGRDDLINYSLLAMSR